MKVLAVVERYPPVLGSDRRIIEILSRLGPGFDVVRVGRPVDPHIDLCHGIHRFRSQGDVPPVTPGERERSLTPPGVT